MSSVLYYVHDPMCSWCWAYQPVWSAVRAELKGSLAVRYLLGGLAADSKQLMAPQMQQAIQATWHRIEAQLGTRFNHSFWHDCRPRRSTYPACRAVIAAERQGRAEDMLNSIQRAYYLNVKNPSDVSVLIALAREQGLDAEQFEVDINSASAQIELDRQIHFSRQLPINGFPSLVLKMDSNQYLPVLLDYSSPVTTLADIRRLLSA